MRRLIFILSALVVVGCSRDEVSEALDQLDVTIARREAIIRDFDSHLESLKEHISRSRNPEEQYALSDSLYHAYQNYNLDSAYKYLETKMYYAELSGKAEFVLKTKLDKSIIKEVKLLDESIRTFNSVSEDEAIRYGLGPFKQYCGYVMYAFASPNRPGKRVEFSSMSRNYRDRYLQSDSTSFESAITRAKMYSATGAYEMIPKFLEGFIRSSKTEEEKAHLYYHCARAWEHMNKMDKAIVCYIKSADSDFKRPVRKYISLTKTAELLIDRGDYGRASKYIKIAAEDILSSKSLTLLSSTAACMLNTSNVVANVEKQRHRTALLFIVIAAISAFVMTGLFFKARRQSKKISRLNDSINKINSELELSNRIRTGYLGTYMIECARYIGKVDENISFLRMTLKEEGIEGLLKQLRKQSFSAAEYERFYMEFDKTFLQIFPEFISKINSIMLPGYEFPDDSSKPLPIELRILAVYRLGLKEYKDISKFLNCALTTVYTYKTRTRRNSKLTPEEFNQFIESINI